MEEKEYRVMGISLGNTPKVLVLGYYDTLQSAIRAIHQYRRGHKIVWLEKCESNGEYARIGYP
ncbi:hypothetical protein ES703_82256 [subsurface metagenome]